MSHIIAVTSQKGGSGKTTITQNLWAALYGMGEPPLLVDADPQGSLSAWALAARDAYVEPPTLLALDAEQILALPRRDLPALVLIDCPPHRGEIARAALAVCDLALIPVRQSPTDLATLGDTLDLVSSERRRRPVKAALVLSQAFPRLGIADEIRDALRASGRIATLLDARTVHRVAYVYAAAEGLGVVDYEPRGRAAAEVIALRDEILSLLEA